MEYIQITECRVGSKIKDGLTKNGEKYKIFTVGAGHKTKQGKFKNNYYECYIQGDRCSYIKDGAIIAIGGTISNNDYNKEDKTMHKKIIFVKDVIQLKASMFKDGYFETEEKQEKIVEEAEELPFD